MTKKYKKGGMTNTQEAYAEGIRTAKGIPGLRTVDKGISKLVSTPKERRMIEKGYEDMLKAKKAKKKAGKDISKRKTLREMKKGGAVKKHRGDGCIIKGRTKGRMV